MRMIQNHGGRTPPGFIDGYAPRAVDFAYFDALPMEIRQILATFPLDVCARDLTTALRGWPLDSAVASLSRQHTVALNDWRAETEELMTGAPLLSRGRP